MKRVPRSVMVHPIPPFPLFLRHSFSLNRYVRVLYVPLLRQWDAVPCGFASACLLTILLAPLQFCLYSLYSCSFCLCTNERLLWTIRVLNSFPEFENKNPEEYMIFTFFHCLEEGPFLVELKLYHAKLFWRKSFGTFR